MEAKERVSLWDNVKCILMFAVVIGHFSNQFADQSQLMKSISIFIYTFHMPLFIFLAGLMERGWNKKHPFRWSKPVYYIFLGYALKGLIFAIKYVFGKNPEFSLWSDTGIPWYMFAMAAYMVIMYVIRNVDPKVGLPVSVLIACLVGYVPEIGSFLYLSRIFVFFPFYYLGYVLRPEDVRRVAGMTWVKRSSVVILGILAAISLFCIEDVFSYIRLLTGRNAYSLINVEGCNMLHRLGFYVVASAVSLAVISLTPEKRNAFASKIGQNTLQIYFWHRLVLYVLMYSGVADWIRVSMPVGWIVVYLGIAVLLTVGLSEPSFGKPLVKMKEYEMAAIRRLAGRRHYQKAVLY